MKEKFPCWNSYDTKLLLKKFSPQSISVKLFTQLFVCMFTHIYKLKVYVCAFIVNDFKDELLRLINPVMHSVADPVWHTPGTSEGLPEVQIICGDSIIFPSSGI